MASLFISVPEKSPDAIDAVLLEAFETLRIDASSPVTGQHHYVDHQFSAFDEDELRRIGQLLANEEASPKGIEQAAFKDELGMEHIVYSMKVEDRVLLNVDSMRERISDLSTKLSEYAAEYEGCWIYYQSRGSDV